MVRQYNTEIYVKNEDWNGGKFPFTTDPIANDKIQAAINAVNTVVKTLERKDPTFSCDDIIFSLKSGSDKLQEYINSEVKRLKAMDRLGTASHYETLNNRINDFVKDRYVTIHDIDADFVQDFEAYLFSRGLRRNSTSFYLRILRAIYNKAVDMGKIEPFPVNPFKHVYVGIDNTVKRAIDVEDIRRIKELNLKRYPKYDIVRDMFMFSFYTRGMSFVDIAKLKKENIYGGMIHYIRSKTKRLYSVRVESNIQAIIDKYSSDDRDYIFDIIKSPETAYKDAKYALMKANKVLKEIAKMCQIDNTLTMYVARHSWANIAYKVAGVPISVISQGMGHYDEKTTRIYLSNFDNSAVDDANNNIINLI